MSITSEDAIKIRKVLDCVRAETQHFAFIDTSTKAAEKLDGRLDEATQDILEYLEQAYMRGYAAGKEVLTSTPQEPCKKNLTNTEL